jgi:VWFA-related protein
MRRISISVNLSKGGLNMKKRLHILDFTLVFLSAMLFAAPLFAQDSHATASGLVQITVTAMSKKSGEAAPALGKQDVSFHENGKKAQIVDWIPTNKPDSKMQLVILIDQDASTRLGSHFDEVASFIRALPANSTVAVAYAMNGVAEFRTPFTADREAVIKSLHITMGAAAGMTSIYETLADMIKHWPGNAPRREVLLLSDGIDPTYGFRNTAPWQNPALEHATRAAQIANVTIFSIFVTTSGLEARSGVLNLNGQGSLNQLTTDTGGYSFFQGSGTAVSFQPFFRDLSGMLSQQYLLTFHPAPSKKADYYRLKVSTEVSHVKLLAPSEIYLPASQ